MKRLTLFAAILTASSTIVFSYLRHAVVGQDDRVVSTSFDDVVGQRTIDIAYRRSADNGKTWTPMGVSDSVEPGCGEVRLARFTQEALTDGEEKFSNFWVSPNRDRQC